jgi:SH3 domain/SAM domain (Sterile alpha motif)
MDFVSGQCASQKKSFLPKYKMSTRSESICWVKHAFVRKSPQEIDLTVGDEILILQADQKDKDGWLYGRNSRTGKEGLFPIVYCTISRETARVVDWTSDQVSSWIQSLNLPETLKLQQKCQWNGEELLDLHMVKLQELGLFNPTTRILFLQAIVSLRTDAQTTADLKLGSVNLKRASFVQTLLLASGQRNSIAKLESSQQRSSNDTRPDSPEYYLKQIQKLADPQEPITPPESIPEITVALVKDNNDNFGNSKEMIKVRSDKHLAKSDKHLAKSDKHAELLARSDKNTELLARSDKNTELLASKDLQTAQMTFSHPTDVVGQDSDDDKIHTTTITSIVYHEQKTHNRNKSCASDYSVFTVSDLITPDQPDELPTKFTDATKFDVSRPVFEKPQGHTLNLPNNHQLSSSETFTLSMEEVTPSTYSS